MSEAGETVRRAYEAFNSGEWEAAEKLLHPDAEYHPDSRTGQGPREGPAAVVAFFREPLEMFDHFRAEIEELIEVDGRVLALLHIAGSGSASGAAFDIRIAHLWELRDDLLFAGRGYADRDEARRELGLDQA